MVTDFLGKMDDQSHSSQQPARSKSKDQSPLDSNPRPHRKKRASIETSQVSQLLWEVVWSPCELTEALCLYFTSIWNILFLPTSLQNNNKKKRWRKRTTKRPQLIIEVMIMYLSSLRPTLFWSNLTSFKITLQQIFLYNFDLFIGAKKGKDKRNKQNSKYYVLSQKTSMV